MRLTGSQSKPDAQQLIAAAAREFTVGHLSAAAEFCQTRGSEHFDQLIQLTKSHPVGSHAYNHAVEVMRLVAEATGSRTVTLQGSPRQIKRQLKRELRNQRKS